MSVAITNPATMSGEEDAGPKSKLLKSASDMRGWAEKRCLAEPDPPPPPKSTPNKKIMAKRASRRTLKI